MMGAGLAAEQDPRWGQGDVFRTGCISITGCEKYALFLDASEPLIRKLAAELFDTFENLISGEETDDALGELCNIMGGMVRHELIGSYQLGLPVVSKARNGGLAIPNGVIIADIKASCKSLPLRLTFLGLDKPGQ
jgi:hypothetical protein